MITHTNALLAKLYKNEFVKYALVGAIATLVDWSSFYVFTAFLHLFYQVALILSFTLGSTTNYVCNKIFTFQNNSKKILQQFSVFATISVISLIASMGIMGILVDILQWQSMASRIFTSIIMLAVNFLMHKYLTFNKRYFK